MCKCKEQRQEGGCALTQGGGKTWFYDGPGAACYAASCTGPLPNTYVATEESECKPPLGPTGPVGHAGCCGTPSAISEPRESGAGRPPAFLGDLTVTSLTVQDRDRPESIKLTAGPDGLKIRLLDGQQRPFIELSAMVDGEIQITLMDTDSKNATGLTITTDGTPILHSRETINYRVRSGAIPVHDLVT